MNHKKNLSVSGIYLLNSKDFFDTKYSRYDIVIKCIKIIKLLEKDHKIMQEPISKLALLISKYVLENFNNAEDFITDYYQQNLNPNLTKSQSKES